MTNPFHGAKLKIERANQHINDLYLQWREFSNTGPYSVLVENDSDTRDSVLQISMDQPAPEAILLIVGDAIHNLMCALDFCMNEMEFAILGKRTKYTKFPVYDTRDELVAAAKGGLKYKTTKAVLDHIVDAVQPYKRGRGEPLWSLHALDIEDKHRLLIAKKDMTYIQNIHCKDSNGQHFTIPEWAIIHPKASRYVCTGHSDVQITNNGKASFGIVFGDGMPLYGQPILPILPKLSHFVSGTINSIERVFLTSKIS